VKAARRSARRSDRSAANRSAVVIIGADADCVGSWASGIGCSSRTSYGRHLQAPAGLRFPAPTRKPKSLLEVGRDSQVVGVGFPGPLDPAGGGIMPLRCRNGCASPARLLFNAVPASGAGPSASGTPGSMAFGEGRGRRQPSHGFHRRFIAIGGAKVSRTIATQATGSGSPIGPSGFT